MKSIFIIFSLTILGLSLCYTPPYVKGDDINVYSTIDWVEFAKFYGCEMDNEYPVIDCCYRATYPCVYYWREKDVEGKNKLREQVDKAVKEGKVQKTNKSLKESLNEELSALKEEVFKDKKASTEEIRNNKKAYTQESLMKQLSINRIIELESFIKEKKERK